MEQDSPAKQFLAAVSKASLELENAIAQTYDEALKLNVQLTESAKVQIEHTDAELEKELRLSTTMVMEERQRILVEIADLRQKEIKVLADLGKSVREQLSKKMEDQVAAFDEKLKSAVQAFQEDLSTVEQRLAGKIEQKAIEVGSLSKDFGDKIKIEVTERTSSLEEFSTKQKQASLKQLERSALDVTQLADTLETGMRQELEKLVSRMSDSVTLQESGGNSPAARLARLSDAALDDEKATSYTAKDLQQIKDMPVHFKNTCEEIARLQVEVQASAVKNLAARYETELASNASYSEEQLKLIASEIQLMLKQFEKTYTDSLEERVSEFEREASQQVQEALSDQERAGLRLSASKDKELKDLFVGLRKNASESLRSTVLETERNLDSLFTELKTGMEKQREQKAQELEKHCREATEQLTLVFKNFETETSEVERQLAELESSTAEIDDFVSALSHADLEF